MRSKRSNSSKYIFILALDRYINEWGIYYIWNNILHAHVAKRVRLNNFKSLNESHSTVFDLHCIISISIVSTTLR